MIEREKCGPDMKEALADSGIFYCYLDDFYSGNSEDIKKNALFKEMYRWIDNSVHLNVNDMFDAALRNTRIDMSPAERRQFYEKHIKHMTLQIDEDGNVGIELKRGQFAFVKNAPDTVPDAQCRGRSRFDVFRGDVHWAAYAVHVSDNH